MSELILPPWIAPADDGETHEWVDDTTMVFRPQLGPGPGQRQSYGGARLRLRRIHRACRAEERAVLMSVLTALEGRTHTLRTRIHQTLRGSFPSTEVFLNNAFSSGTDNWAAYNDFTISMSDRIYRGTTKGTSNNGAGGPAGNSYPAYQAPTVVQYAPYVTRAMVRSFGGVVPYVYSNLAGSAIPSAQASLASGYAAVAAVANGEGGVTAGILSAPIGSAGGGIDIYWTSCSRCALVDAQPNSFLYSDDIGNAYWTKSGGSITGADTDPFGGTTADILTEDGTTGQHFFSRSETRASAIEDWCVFGITRRVNGTRNARLVIASDAGSNFAEVTVNLATGAILAGPSVTGSATNPRAAVVSMGNGYYAIMLIGRLAATTTVNAMFFMMDVGTSSYAGNGTSSLSFIRCGAVRSSSFTLGSPTTTVTGSSPPLSGATSMWLRGLAASTLELLQPGDWVEVNGELKTTVVPLNSDAAGRGLWQFIPALVRSPPDNTPAIVRIATGKFQLASSLLITNRFQTQSDIEYELETVYE